FEAANVEEYDIPAPVQLILFFDSFHHLTKPAQLIKRLEKNVERWALIEPRGDWLGRWQKDLDFDWLTRDLDHIRARAARLCGEPPHSLQDSPHADAICPDEAAVEHRYALDDFE